MLWRVIPAIRNPIKVRFNIRFLINDNTHLNSSEIIAKENVTIIDYILLNEKRHLMPT